MITPNPLIVVDIQKNKSRQTKQVNGRSESRSQFRSTLNTKAWVKAAQLWINACSRRYPQGFETNRGQNELKRRKKNAATSCTCQVNNAIAESTGRVNSAVGHPTCQGQFRQFHVIFWQFTRQTPKSFFMLLNEKKRWLLALILNSSFFQLLQPLVKDINTLLGHAILESIFDKRRELQANSCAFQIPLF